MSFIFSSDIELVIPVSLSITISLRAPEYDVTTFNPKISFNDLALLNRFEYCSSSFSSSSVNTIFDISADNFCSFSSVMVIPNSVFRSSIKPIPIPVILINSLSLSYLFPDFVLVISCSMIRSESPTIKLLLITSIEGSFIVTKILLLPTSSL